MHREKDLFTLYNFSVGHGEIGWGLKIGTTKYRTTDFSQILK